MDDLKLSISQREESSYGTCRLETNTFQADVENQELLDKRGPDLQVL